jgi:hypothetical protein
MCYFDTKLPQNDVTRTFTKYKFLYYVETKLQKFLPAKYIVYPFYRAKSMVLPTLLDKHKNNISTFAQCWRHRQSERALVKVKESFNNGVEIVELFQIIFMKVKKSVLIKII